VSTKRQAFRASLLHLLDDPCAAGDQAAVWHEDGLLLVEDGHVAAAGAWAELAPALPAGTPVEALPGRILTPGFIDAHVHYPQTDVVAAWGARLLDWLATHTFPVEQAFEDRAHADEAAAFFLDELLRNGTTSALVFGTVHRTSVDALFEAALARNMRLIGGKVLMDRNAPAALCDTVETGRADSEALIRAWRGRGRLGYAVTPRFAVTSSDAQLAMAGQLAADHPDILVHTHMSENLEEIATVEGLFPEHGSYLGVYERFGLVTGRSVLAHCVHTEAADLRRLAAAGASAAFCPSSNLMLGSGLFSLKQACDCGTQVALGTDIGAGASFSLLSTIGEAYRVGQLQHEPLDPLHALYLATLAGARALKIDHRVGNFAVGKEADFVVLDLAATPLMARRTAAARTLRDRLFALSILGDDRAIERTYLMGRLAHARGGALGSAA
jgi:guanine deaminase